MIGIRPVSAQPRNRGLAVCARAHGELALARDCHQRGDRDDAWPGRYATATSSPALRRVRTR
jgi:hypothetical protein